MENGINCLYRLFNSHHVDPFHPGSHARHTCRRIVCTRQVFQTRKRSENRFCDNDQARRDGASTSASNKEGARRQESGRSEARQGTRSRCSQGSEGQKAQIGAGQLHDPEG